jgi:outer membrane protein OmpA-like peptidoglycan-associated protein
MSASSIKLNRSILVVGAVAMALSSVTHAGVSAASLPSNKSAPTKEEKTGMASGAVVGALIGGPFGAVVGVMVGAIAGTGAHQVRETAKQAKQLEHELAETRVALSNATEAQKNQSQVDQLAQQLRGDVLFRTNSAELEANSAIKLSELGSVLARHPVLSIEIDGYADPRGKSQANMELSQQRASAVRTALMIGGAAAEQIKIAAHGAELSTASSGDLEAYAWERRVSLAVVAQEPSNQVAQAK